MKKSLWIPPLVSLAIAAGLIGSQQASIGRLENQTVVLRERIETVRNGSGVAGDHSLASRMKEKDGSEGDEIDWKELGGKLAGGQQGRMPDMRAMMELQTRLMELDGTELLAELDKIEALDLGKDIKDALDNMLVGLLLQKEPKLVLDRFLDRVNDRQGSMSWQLSNAFQRWQDQEPQAAIAWLDSRIADGSFESKSLDGRNEARLRFEAAAVGGLLSSDPQTARRRVEALPEDQRKQLFQQGMFWNLEEDSQPAFAELVRATVPEGERGEAYNQTVSMLMSGGDFEKVDGFIERIGSDQQERDAIAGQAVKSRMQRLANEGNLDRAAVDEMREWASNQAPDEVDAITGNSLANLWGNRSSFEDRARIVEQLHEEGAGDELIVAFLEDNRQVRESSELARSLAERLGDGERRAELLEKIDRGADRPASGIEATELQIGN